MLLPCKQQPSHIAYKWTSSSRGCRSIGTESAVKAEMLVLQEF